MKTNILIFTLIRAFLLFFNGCIVNIVGKVSTPIPADPSMLKLVAFDLLTVYEVVVCIVPSVDDYSVVSWFFSTLKRYPTP